MSNPRTRGGDNNGKTPGLPMKNSQGRSHNPDLREIQHENLSVPASSQESQAQQALNDAQQGLHSLLNPPVEDDQPHIISLSGATRNQGYRAIIPMDGTNANSQYEWEYTMHQLNNVSFSSLFTFTTLDQLSFVDEG